MIDSSKAVSSSQPVRPRIQTFAMGLLGANAYLLETSGSNVLIDPGGDPPRGMAALPALAAIICTHGHFDHISGVDTLRQLTGAPLLIHAADADALTDPAVNASRLIGQPLRFRPAEQLLQDGDELALDPDHTLRVLATPGHTPGGICLLLLERSKPIALFSGDTLFQGSIGRLDIGGNASAMRASLARLTQLPDALPVYPGHGPATTIGRERQENPYLQPGNDILDDLD